MIKTLTSIFLGLLIPCLGVCQCSIVADYEFTGNTNDASSYNLTATDAGATLAPDRFGNPNSAYSFNGTSNYIIADTNNRGVTNRVTVSAWIQTTSTATMGIAEKYRWEQDRGYSIAVINNKAQFSGRDGSGEFSEIQSQVSVNDGQWHLITGVYRGSQWELWVDGVLENKLVTGNTTGQLANPEPLSIGIDYDSKTIYFQGEIDEVKLWNCALDSATIASMYSKAVLCMEVADYEFTGNTNDASSYNLTATDAGATLAPDRFGNPNSAYSFNGVSNYITCDTNNRGITSEVTLSAWIQTTAANNGAFIVGKYHWQEDHGYNLVIANNKAEFEGRDGSGSYQQTGLSKTTVNDGRWHLITGVVRNGTWEIWVDGVLENDSVSGKSNLQLANTEPLVIGYYANGQESYYSGTIDEVKLWNCALDSATIAAAYSKPPVLCLEVADYEFTGNTNDASDYDITAINYGATLTTDRFGVSNSAYSFDGTSNYITADTNNRGVTNRVTVSAWIQTTSTATMAIVEKYRWEQDRGYGIAAINSKAQVSGRDGSGEFYAIQSQVSINDGKWHLITGVYRGSQWEIWVDGVLENTLVTGNTTGQLASPEPLSIGINYDAKTIYFQGEIDEVKLWNCALDSTALASMHSGPAQLTSITSAINSSQITVFPSPTSGMLNIQGNTQNISEIVITDYTGRSLLDVPFSSQLSVSNLRTGVYVILFKGTGGSVLESLKFVKE